MKALGVDTTARNTSRIDGACVRKNGQTDTYIACRQTQHHIHEIILESVFLITMGPSTGPEILLVKSK